MTQFGIQASHEQFEPNYLLELVQHAERFGFTEVLASDHISPWGNSQENSGFTWAWLGAAMQSTNIAYSSVTVPGYRYHPVILAQAIATLCHMFPGRFVPCIGSGEALNEHVVGQGWPDKQQRHKIVEESISIMRRLWQGQTVSHQGVVVADQAKLYVKPPTVPIIYGAALTDSTAAWLASWADGMVTVADDIHKLKGRMQAFYDNGGQGKPVIVKADCSFAHDYQQALDEGYRQWRYLLLPPSKLSDLKMPQDFEDATRTISKEEFARKLPIITTAQQALDWLIPLKELDLEKIILHNVNTNQVEFVKYFGAEVLPNLKN